MTDRQRPQLTICLSLLALIVGLGACSRPANHNSAANADYWTCGMHPSVHSKTPGKCPICGMDLAPVARQKGESPEFLDAALRGGDHTTSHALATRGIPGQGDTVGQSESSEFSIPIRRQQQIGVTYADVRRRPMRLDIRTVGTLEVHQALSFRVRESRRWLHRGTARYFTRRTRGRGTATNDYLQS